MKTIIALLALSLPISTVAADTSKDLRAELTGGGYIVLTDLPCYITDQKTGKTTITKDDVLKQRMAYRVARNGFYSGGCWNKSTHNQVNVIMEGEVYMYELKNFTPFKD